MGAVEKLPDLVPDESIVSHEDVKSVREHRAATALYANRIKVYPKAITGQFRRITWAALALCLTI